MSNNAEIAASEKKTMAPMWEYVIWTYALFWLMVLGICGTASMVFHASPLTMRWLSNLCAWSPTIMLLILFKKLKPGMTLKEFFSNAFSGKLDWKLFILIPVVISGAVLISVCITSGIEQQALSSYFTMGSVAWPLAVILSLLSGPTGEESGWRGYLRNELNDKYGFLKGSLLLGVIWAGWHMVLWFVDSDFMDLRMIPYVLANVIVMTCLALIMNIVLEKHNNLLYAIWIHFAFNLPYSFLNIGIWFYIVLSVVFVIVAAAFWFARSRETKNVQA